MCANLARCCSASSGITMVAAICELSDNTNCDMDQFAKNLWVVSWKTLQNHRTGKIWGWALARKWVLAWVQYNSSHGFSL